MGKKKPGLTLEEHKDLGKKLKAISKEMTVIGHEIEKCYGTSSKGCRTLHTIVNKMVALRSFLDGRVCREHPDDDSVLKIYFGCDNEGLKPRSCVENVERMTPPEKLKKIAVEQKDMPDLPKPKTMWPMDRIEVFEKIARELEDITKLEPDDEVIDRRFKTFAERFTLELKESVERNLTRKVLTDTDIKEIVSKSEKDIIDALKDRIARKGKHAFVSIHEILGVVNEEHKELIDAV